MPQITPIALHEATRHRYLNYALSVITSRALPDVRDGLKPVQRRILYAMYHNLRLLPDGRFRKSAAVVGGVMAKYHPHGDSSIYDALVRMVQPFAMRHPLILGQGNFGSMDGDSAAAMRYSECKLAPIAVELLSELKQRTVGYRPNYDGQHFEAIVLPAQFPQLLVNGSEGIAVGMATRIPPHNLREVIDAAVVLLDDPDATISAMTRKLKAPDFPTGGIILNNREELQDIYETGGGPVKLQGSWRMEKEGRRWQIIVDSIPYSVNKGTLVEKIGNLIADRKLPLLSDVRDESTDEVRVVLELNLKRGADPDATAAAAMAYLFKHTPLQITYPVNLTCLVPTDNPEVCAPVKANLREILRYWLDFRRDTVRRRFEFELQKLRKRIHILEALAKIFDVLDEVIVMIRQSEGRRDAHEKLIDLFDFSDEQADAILELKLYRLAKLEIHAVQEELEEKRADAERIESILSSAQNLWAVVRQELMEVRRIYGEKRRTKIGTAEVVEYEESAYIVAEDSYLIVTRDGWVKRQNSFTDVSKIRIKEGDEIIAIGKASTKKTVCFFTDQGGAYVLRFDDVEATTGYGKPIQSYFQFSDGEKIVGIALHDARSLPPARTDKDAAGNPIVEALPGPYGVGITYGGRIVRFPLSVHEEPSQKKGRRFARLQGRDAVMAVEVCSGSETISLATQKGRALCFAVSEVSVLKGAGKGVTAIKLDAGDTIHAFGLTTKLMGGVTVTTPQGRAEVVRPNKFLGSRAIKGKSIIKRGSFKDWTRPMVRYDEQFKAADTTGEE
ncbi:MAG: DNA topoisomerase 4 subunit A [Myxococcota bacterium]|nr:DNA topoisomerase 4 subunit A [Myxococcota bacterium]